MAIKQKTHRKKTSTKVIKSYRLSPIIVDKVEKQAEKEKRTNTDVLESILARHYRVNLSKNF